MIVERPNLERRVLASVDAGRIPVLLGGCGVGRTSALLRLTRMFGSDRGQYLDFSAAATTPERCLAAVTSVCRFGAGSEPTPAPASARGAVDALLDFFDEVTTVDGGPPTFLVDEILDIRTFESFPGLRHVQREILTRLAASPARFVLASRFTSRVHRLLRDGSARFEVVHVAPLDATETAAIALQLDGGRREWAAHVAPAVSALAAGRAAYTTTLFDALTSMGPAIDPVAALATLFAPDGRLTARCRQSYDLRLQSARGYGALKAILGILAAAEPLNLTQIAHLLQRTPGSTKDYLSWLEDVDLIRAQGKRYSFDDPLLRLYVRLYGRPVPPTDDDIVREVAAYAKLRLPETSDAVVSRAAPVSIPAPVASAAGESLADVGKASGIIEID